MTRTVRYLAYSLILLFAACTGYHEGMPGVFRSPFQREEQLLRRLEDDQIKTILCLRGTGKRQSMRAADAHDAAFVFLPFSAKRLPRPDTLRQLWQFAETAERPVLVHCRAGVDRTGLALAVIELHDSGDLDRARSHLSFVPYGHIPAFGTDNMDRVLDLYEPFVGKLPFPVWIDRVYAKDYERLKS